MTISVEMIQWGIATAGAVLTGAVGKMWLAFNVELKDCKEDRKALHLRSEELHNKIADVSLAVGRMEGRLAERDATEST